MSSNNREAYPPLVGDLLPLIAVLAFFVAVMGGLAWLASRAAGRRVGSSVAGPFEEIWHPSAHRARITIEVQDERRVETPSPGDPPNTSPPAG